MTEYYHFISMIRFASASDGSSSVAHLIYETDSVMGSLFGGRPQALVSLQTLFESKDNSFSYEHTLVYEDNSDILGLLIAYDPHRTRTYTYKQKETQVYKRALSCWQLCRLWFASLFLGAMEDKSQMDGVYIQNISVSASTRGQGIGTQLIDFAAKWAQSQQYHSLWLDVAFENHKARKLYEKQGFILVSKHTLFMSKRGFYRMRKPLNEMK